MSKSFSKLGDIIFKPLLRIEYVRSYILYIICLFLSVATLIYIVWWSLQGEYSGYYTHLYGYTIWDKLAFTAFIILTLIMVVSFIKVWHEKKYLSFLIGPALATFLWFQIFDSGTETLGLKGCFESICSDVSIKDNGTFWITVSTQNDSYRYDGHYIIEEGTINLYDKPNFDSFQQLESIIQIKQQECIQVNAVDFNLWSGCFTLPKSGHKKSKMNRQFLYHLKNSCWWILRFVLSL